MADFVANNLLGGSQQPLATTSKSLLSLNASASVKLKRVKVWGIAVGCDGSPLDNSTVWDLVAITAAGTGTAVTPNPLDPADPAALAVAVANYTAEPTVTAASAVWARALNQRATYGWTAKDGCELVIPAVAAAGLALRARSPSGYTGTGVAELSFRE